MRSSRSSAIVGSYRTKLRRGPGIAGSTHSTDTTDHQGAEDEPDGSCCENEPEAQVATTRQADEQVTRFIQEVKRLCRQGGAKRRGQREGHVPQRHVPA